MPNPTYTAASQPHSQNRYQEFEYNINLFQYSTLAFMRQILLFIIISFTFLLSCKKEESEPIKPTVKEPLAGSFIKEITQNSAVFQYEITQKEVVETGVYISVDSLKLTAPDVSGAFTKATYDKDLNSYKAEVIALDPYSTYWYTIKIKHSSSTTFSKIEKFTTKGFNLKWQEGFSKKIKLVEPLYRDIVLTGINADPEVKNYEVMYGDMSCWLRLIQKVESSPNTYSYHIQVPASAPVGKRKFSIFYKKRKIFEDDLEVEKGNMYKISKVGLSDKEVDRAYFSFNNKLYTVYLNSSSTYHLDIWDPMNNQWTRKTIPSEVGLRKGMSGVEINGRIYFTAFSESVYSKEHNTTVVQEKVYSYDPIANKWEYSTLYTSTNTNEMLIPYGAFAYEDKLYCFVGRYSNGGSQNQQLLKVYNPVDKSWETVMELKNGARGYRAITIQGKIFVLETQERSHYSATVDFKYVLYELDLASKALIKKGTPIFDTLEKGALEPVIFAYKDHLYVYGGKSSIGFLGYGSTDLYEYAPETNTWTMLFLSPNGNIPSQEHFGYVMNGKFYFGLGLTARSEWNNEIWELNLE